MTIARSLAGGRNYRRRQLGRAAQQSDLNVDAAGVGQLSPSLQGVRYGKRNTITGRWSRAVFER